MLLCCKPDTAYGLLPIRRISDESALVVEIDFTWSLGFGSVELVINLDERVLQTMCNKPLQEYSPLPLTGSHLCSVALA
ncbi:hypothetical protein Tco_0816679 [Tanacetum coccineum]